MRFAVAASSLWIFLLVLTLAQTPSSNAEQATGQTVSPSASVTRVVQAADDSKQQKRWNLTVQDLQPDEQVALEPSSPPPPLLQQQSPGIDACKVNVPDSIVFGVSIDWGSDSPAAFNGRLGHPAAVFQYFATIQATGVLNKDWLWAAADETLAAHATLSLTIEPWDGLSAVGDAAIQDLVQLLSEINGKGLTVILRYAHEMNANWYPWGQKPQAYVESFRRVANAVKAHTSKTFMAWVPNAVDGYPFGMYSPNSPAQGSADFHAMDTNGDGQINGADDPFTPFWPGPEYVDWVGLDAYHLGNINDATNTMPEPDAFRRSLQFPGLGGGQWSIYHMFAERFNKPLGIFETAAAFYANAPDSGNGATNFAIKQAWWRQVFGQDIHQAFPLLRMVCWFEIAKYESSGSQWVARDFTLTKDRYILDHFKDELVDWVRFANTLPQ